MHFKHKPNSWSKKQLFRWNYMTGMRLWQIWDIHNITTDHNKKFNLWPGSRWKNMFVNTNRPWTVYVKVIPVQRSPWSLYALQMCWRIRLAEQNQTNTWGRESAETIHIISLGFLKDFHVSQLLFFKLAVGNYLQLCAESERLPWGKLNSLLVNQTMRVHKSFRHMWMS